MYYLKRQPITTNKPRQAILQDWDETGLHKLMCDIMQPFNEPLELEMDLVDQDEKLEEWKR